MIPGFCLGNQALAKPKVKVNTASDEPDFELLGSLGLGRNDPTVRTPRLHGIHDRAAAPVCR